MQFTLAQEIYFELAANANFDKSYKAPHAYRGTPPRPHSDRKHRRKTLFSKSHDEMKHFKPKLFKGHRP